MTFISQRLALGPLRHYRLGADAGAVMTDSMGNGNGTYNTGTIPPLVAGAVASDSNQARSFTAASSQFGRSDAEITEIGGATAATIIGAMKKAAGSIIMSAGVGTGANPAFRLQAHSDGRLYAVVCSGGSNSFYNCAWPSDGNYHHVALRFIGTNAAGSRVEIFVDKVNQTLTANGAQPAALGANDGTNKFEVGHSSDGYSTGEADEWSIFNYALTNTQISDDYDAMVAGSGNSIPNTPIIGHGTITNTSVDLTGSSFSDPDSADTHAASQWQVTLSADTTFSSPVVNTGDDSTNKVVYTATGLTPSTAYLARVRYKDSAGNYSNWATADTFTTTAAPDTTPPVPVFTTSSDGLNLIANFPAEASGPILPATNVTIPTISPSGGLTNGVAVTASAGIRTGSLQFTWPLSRRIYKDETLLASIGTNNITDSAATPNGMAPISNASVANVSTWTGCYIPANQTKVAANNFGNQATYQTFVNFELKGESKTTSIFDWSGFCLNDDNITGDRSVVLQLVKYKNAGTPTTVNESFSPGSVTGGTIGIAARWKAGSSGVCTVDRVTADASNAFDLIADVGTSVVTVFDGWDQLANCTNGANSTPETSTPAGRFWLSGGSGTGQFINCNVRKGWLKWEAQSSKAWFIGHNVFAGIRAIPIVQGNALRVTDNTVHPTEGAVFSLSAPGGQFGSQNSGLVASGCASSEIDNNVLNGGQWIVRGLGGDFHHNILLNMSSHAAIIDPETGTLIHHNIFAPSYGFTPTTNKGWIVFSGAITPTGVKVYNNTFDQGVAELATAGSPLATSVVLNVEFYDNIIANIRVVRVAAGDAAVGPDNDSEAISGSPLRPATNLNRMGYANYNTFWNMLNRGSTALATYAIGVTGESQGIGNFGTNDLAENPQFVGAPANFGYADSDIFARTVLTSSIITAFRNAYAPTNANMHNTGRFGGDRGAVAYQAASSGPRSIFRIGRVRRGRN